MNACSEKSRRFCLTLRGKAFPLGSARHSKSHYDRTTQFAGGLHHTPFFRAPPRTPLFPATKLGKTLNGYNSDAFVGFIAKSHHILRPRESFPLEFSDKSRENSIFIAFHPQSPRPGRPISTKWAINRGNSEIYS